jgi:hypothetical protein
MFKPLSACVLAGLSLSCSAQSTLPPEAEVNLQQRADAHYQTSVRLCAPLQGSALFQPCINDAARSRERFVSNGRGAYYAVTKAQDSKQQFLDTADRCRLDASRACSEAMQQDAEQYYEDRVDAYVSTHRR